MLVKLWEKTKGNELVSVSGNGLGQGMGIGLGFWTEIGLDFRKDFASGMRLAQPSGSWRDF